MPKWKLLRLGKNQRRSLVGSNQILFVEFGFVDVMACFISMQRGGCYNPLFELVWNVVHLERKDIDIMCQQIIMQVITPNNM